MAFTRKYLEGLGIEAEKVDLIIDAHDEVVRGLKQVRDDLKEKADKADELKKELDTLKAKSTSDTDWEKKFNEEHAEYEKYKQEVADKETLAAKESAYKGLLKEAGVSEKLIALIMKGTDLSTVELEDGKIKDADKVSETIKTEYKDYITSTEGSGTKTETPPAGGTPDENKLEDLSMEDYIKARSKS